MTRVEKTYCWLYLWSVLPKTSNILSENVTFVQNLCVGTHILEVWVELSAGFINLCAANDKILPFYILYYGCFTHEPGVWY